VQFGEFNVETLAVGEEKEVHSVLRVGDMIEIDRGKILLNNIYYILFECFFSSLGTRYSIQNAIDKVSVLMCIRS